MGYSFLAAVKVDRCVTGGLQLLLNNRKVRNLAMDQCLNLSILNR